MFAAAPDDPVRQLEARLIPESTQGFVSGSARHCLIDRRGVVRERSVDRLALPDALDRLLAEP